MYLPIALVCGTVGRYMVRRVIAVYGIIQKIALRSSLVLYTICVPFLYLAY